MSSLSRRAQVYIWAVLFWGGVLLVWHLAHLEWEGAQSIVLLAVTLLAATAQVLKVEGATARSSYEISWVAFGFAVVSYGPSGGLLVITAAYLVEWIWNRQKWYIATYNIASFAITVSAADVARQWISAGQNPSEWLGALGLIAATGIFTFINHVMIGLVIWLARGEPISQNGLLDKMTLLIDFATFGLGVVAALIWALNPLVLVLVLAPLSLIYSALRIPALQRQTQLDAKTGLYNASYFNEALEKELARAERFDRPLTVVVADLDLLRNINNTYGHLAGDTALMGVANILRRMVREYDVVARFGGEEFAILMPETHPQKALARIEAIRSAIEVASFEVTTSPIPLSVTMSFGVAGREAAGLTPKSLIHNADVAVYRAKLLGRNRVCFFSRGDVYNLAEAVHLPAPEISEPLLTEEALTLLPLPEPASTPTPTPTAPVTEPAPLPRWWLRAFVGGLAGVALTLVWLNLPLRLEINWLGLGLFALIVLVTEWLAIDIYVRDTSVSTSVAPFVAGVLLFGPVGAIVLSAVLATTAWVKHHSPMSRLLFNASNHLISALLTVNLTMLAGGAYAQQPALMQAVVTVLAASLAYLCNTGLITLAIYLDSGQPLEQTWKKRFGWLWPYYLAFGVVAYALVWAFLANGWLGVTIMFIPLLMLRFSQSEYLRRTKTTVSQLKAANHELLHRAENVAKLNDDLIRAMSRAVDFRDPYAKSHSQHVARYAELMAQELGLAPERIELIQWAGLLHDIGKLGVPESILFKPDKLTPEEYRVIQQHSVIGAAMIQHLVALRPLIPFIRHHHERFDGRGYPDALREHTIPLEARILSVADAVEAMASDRPYRKGMEAEAVLAELRRNSGAQFDPQVVAAFERVIRRYGLTMIVNSAETSPVHALPDLALSPLQMLARRRYFLAPVLEATESPLRALARKRYILQPNPSSDSPLKKLARKRHTLQPASEHSKAMTSPLRALAQKRFILQPVVTGAD